MREFSVCFTGHRDLEPADFERLQTALPRVLEQKIREGYRYFYAGGALGFDTFAAQTVLELRQIYPQIRLCLVLPCRTQSLFWSEESKIVYEEILAVADRAEFLSENYFQGCMYARNRRMVELSSFCICYLNGGEGGSFYTVGYAQRKGLEVFNLGRRRLCRPAGKKG